jgi:hypothetical protein
VLDDTVVGVAVGVGAVCTGAVGVTTTGVGATGTGIGVTGADTTGVTGTAGFGFGAECRV